MTSWTPGPNCAHSETSLRKDRRTSSAQNVGIPTVGCAAAESTPPICFSFMAYVFSAVAFTGVGGEGFKLLNETAACYCARHTSGCLQEPGYVYP